jgi:molybdopterin molybdotransferase
MISGRLTQIFATSSRNEWTAHFPLPSAKTAAMNERNLQRIDRLTPLAEVVGKLKAMAKPVAPVEIGIEAGLGLTLVHDLVSAAAKPSFAIALRDGWAVRADALAGASSYSPLPLEPAPPWVNAGDKLPDSADSVAPFDAIAFTGALAQAVAQVFPGEGILQQGGYTRSDAVLKQAGSRLRATDIAAATLADIANVKARKPRIALVQGGERDVSATLSFLVRAIETRGGSAEIVSVTFEKFLASKFEEDAIIAVGGTGGGRNDTAVEMLTSRGEVAVHGVAIAPGETSALGQAQGKPVLLLPGRFDAALAGWLLIGQPLLDALAGYSEGGATTTVTLARKIASAPGIAEIVPLRIDGTKALPLGSGVLSLEKLSLAHGWVLVPPESEGFAEGAEVEMRPLP